MYYLWQHHQNWGHAQFATALGASQGWVKKWLKRFREELAQGLSLEKILQGHSPTRKQSPPKTHPQVVERVLSIRDHPPEGLRRVPGQKAIRYYLERDPLLQQFQLPIRGVQVIHL